MSGQCVCGKRSPRVGVGPGLPAVGSAPSSDPLLLGLLWKSHMFVFLVGDSLYQRAEPQARPGRGIP